VTLTTSVIDTMIKAEYTDILCIYTVEGAEEMAIEGMGPLFKSGNVEHFVMETRKQQAPLVKTFYDYGYECGSYSGTSCHRTSL
jgi:hypothetical protein